MFIPVHLLSAAETAETFITLSDIPDALSAIAAVFAVAVSALVLGRSYRVSQRAAYPETITASRERWQISLRACSAQYFSQLMRVCSPDEQNDYEAFTQLTRYHHEIRLY